MPDDLQRSTDCLKQVKRATEIALGSTDLDERLRCIDNIFLLAGDARHLIVSWRMDGKAKNDRQDACPTEEPSPCPLPEGEGKNGAER